MELSNVINFFLFGYFGITLDEKEEKRCVFACIMKAYSDATNQGAYNTKIENLQEQSNIAKKNAATTLYKSCLEYFTQQDAEKPEYDDWHSDLCYELVNTYKDVKHPEDKTSVFTYGNAQKWVNMTVKYLTMLVSLGMLESYEALIDKNKSKFHIPIDSYILSALWRNEETTNELKEKFPAKKAVNSNHDSSKVNGWSNWDNKSYEHFRSDVIGKIICQEDPLDYENKVWITEAKRRKGNEINSKIASFFKEDIT